MPRTTWVPLWGPQTFWRIHGSYTTITGKISTLTPVRRGAQACGEIHAPEQEALFVGESLACQKLGDSKAREAPVGLGWSYPMGRVLAERADPAQSRELSLWENMGEPENLGSYTQKIVRE